MQERLPKTPKHHTNHPQFCTLCPEKNGFLSDSIFPVLNLKKNQKNHEALSAKVVEANLSRPGGAGIRKQDPGNHRPDHVREKDHQQTP